MDYIPRIIEQNIKKRLFRGKIIVIYGARQVGKTTLAKKILAEYDGRKAYFNCELLSVVRGLSELEAVKIKAFLGERELIVLDEAQNIPDIGKVLKIMVDTYPETQIIATGSASFDLMQKISEPMTGRNFTFVLYPLALKENITPIENALDKTLKLQGVYFDWKADNSHDMGMIAEDVQPVIPEVVHQQSGIVSLAYDRLVALTIEAIKELKAENDALKELICPNHPTAKICEQNQKL